ncbi:glycine betaine ABC transporter substrate-binding protein [Salinactinospora qingdaonensis]|uniref:ABC-type glycine betaine transport system substrate-binding domain-containing protein n=1 Tax=Salinactinospora qingdaonensis TaxID=702744 RepID=A0ABP7FK80_9ACTN
MPFIERSGRKLGLGAAVASLALLASACGGSEEGGVSTESSESESAGGGEKSISIAVIPWDEDIAVSNLWKVVLEEKGYTVELQNVDVAPMFEGIAQGDIDLFLDTWLPGTHADYWEQHQDNVEDLGSWYDNATLELTVPSYVEDVNSIADLKGNEDMFGGEIVGIESGSGLVRTTKEEAIPTYSLDDYTLVESSTSAMLTELDDAIKNEEPIVVTLWRPHIAYSDYDLKDLEDPEGAMGEGESIHAIGRTGFSEDFPEVNEWMQEFAMDDPQLQSLEHLILNENEDDPEAGARAWLQENPDYLSGIMGEDAEGLDFSS